MDEEGRRRERGEEGERGGDLESHTGYTAKHTDTGTYTRTCTDIQT